MSICDRGLMEKKRFIIRLAGDISDSPHLTEKFISELAFFSGVKVDEIENIYVRPGCTLITGRMDKSAVERLVAYFEKIKSGETPSDPELIELAKLITLWKIEILTDEYEAESYTISVMPNGKTAKALILVHGWGGNVASTFGNLPKYLSEILGIRVLVYDYPTGWLRSSPSVVFVSRNLDNWIRNNLPDHEFGLVGHSLGGLVVRYLSVMQACHKTPLTPRQITLVASPSGGTHWASIAERIPALRSTQIAELSPNSSFLFDLNNRWAFWKEQHVPKHCRIGAIFGINDRIVNISSATASDPEAIPILECNHTNIVKPDKPNHEIVMTLARLSREAGMCA